MPDYFLVLDGEFFHGRLCASMARCWRDRNFEPCRELCASLAPAARDYARLYHAGNEEPLLCQAALGLSFDRTCWRTLVGEMLLIGSVEIPEFPTDLETLVCLLAPERYRLGCPDVPEGRAGLSPIEQALRGSRDVTIGATVYRPFDAGLNDSGDVERLATYLENIDPQRWNTGDLRELRDAEEEDRADELAFVREWFPEFAGLFARCRREGRVVVAERIY
jgi:hypothetical protein